LKPPERQQILTVFGQYDIKEYYFNNENKAYFLLSFNALLFVKQNIILKN